uniref:Uncharacterized protein n=1 Tax=Myotis myotis TaxID=51298 RepID=A0A7J7Z567_MYOMY|nr:hypothetical protein mMyoMyo1_010573 [Myotis myotis]
MSKGLRGVIVDMCHGCWVSEGQLDLTGVSGTGKWAFLDTEPLIPWWAFQGQWLGPREHTILKGEAAEARSAPTPTPRLPLDTTRKPHSEPLSCKPCSEWCTTLLLAPCSDHRPERPPALHLVTHTPRPSTTGCLTYQCPVAAPVPHASTPYTRTWLTWTLHSHSPCLDSDLQGPPSRHAWIPHTRSLCQDKHFKILCMPRSGTTRPHGSPAPAIVMGTSWILLELHARRSVHVALPTPSSNSGQLRSQIHMGT